MRERLPWWVRIVAKLALSRLPVGYETWQRLGVFRHGAMDDPNYAIRVFDRHWARTGSRRAQTVLELGPGDSIATAVLAPSVGTRATLVDGGRYVDEDIDRYMDLASALRRRRRPSLDLSACSDVDDVLAVTGARYMTAGLTSLREVDTAGTDLVF